MKLVFVRHGQTDYNTKGIVQGQEIDSAINDVGRKQIESLRLKLPDEIDCIYSSPLKRAAQSAEILAKNVRKPIEYRDDLKEYSYGKLAGKTWPEISAMTGEKEAYEKDINVTFDYSKYGGETADQVKARVAKFVEDAKKDHADQTCIVSSHGGVIEAMYALYPKERTPVENATIHEFDV